MTSHLLPDLEVEGLQASAPHRLPFAPSLSIRAFALSRAAGDVLVYSAPLADRLGPAGRWYLTHWHESLFAPSSPPGPAVVHRDDREHTERKVRVRGTYARHHVTGGDLEVIPIPGHTAGATALLWQTGRHRVLFTGDSVLLEDGEWLGAVLDSSDRAAYLDSLDLLRGLEFDVLVPWAATAGGPWWAVTDPADAHRRLTSIIDRVWRGGDR